MFTRKKIKVFKYVWILCLSQSYWMYNTIASYWISRLITHFSTYIDILFRRTINSNLPIWCLHYGLHLSILPPLSFTSDHKVHALSKLGKDNVTTHFVHFCNRCQCCDNILYDENIQCIDLNNTPLEGLLQQSKWTYAIVIMGSLDNIFASLLQCLWFVINHKPKSVIYNT